MRKRRPWRWPARVALVVGLFAGGWLALGWFVFGLRLPPLQWEPTTLTEVGEASLFRVEADGASFLGEEDGVLVFRAYVPEPMLLVTAKEPTSARLRLENLSPRVLDEGFPASQVLGLTRSYTLPIQPEEGLVLKLRLPQQERYRFAALGDTGGGEELRQALDRAAALGADFFLHLGDLQYTETGLQDASTILAAAPLPVYAAIGNHDFHGKGDDLVGQFQRLIGPRNAYFTLAGVSFLNLDTAADTYPAAGGERGKLVRRLWDMAHPEQPLVVFTHRPLADPRVDLGHIDEEADHALHHQAEVDWLQQVYDHFGADLVLNGHIHASYETTIGGIPTWVVGNGLELPEIGPDATPLLLLGEWSAQKPLRWHTEPLQSP